MSPVTLTIDFGSFESVARMDIAWAFVPKAFSVLVSDDGARFQTAFSTDANIANFSSIFLDGRPVSAAKIVMSEAPFDVEHDAICCTWLRRAANGCC